MGMQAQNIGIIGNINTLRTVEPIWSRPGVSPTGGTRKDLQKTHSLRAGKIIAVERGAIVAAPATTLDF